MKENKDKLTLYQPATYQIKVPRILNGRWLDWNGEMTLIVDNDENNQPITTLISTFDQAALHGLLRRLYSMGLSLILVMYVEIS